MSGDDAYLCPEPSVLGAFVEGRLDAAARAAVDRHLATCAECVGIVGDATRFLEEETDEVSDAEVEPPTKLPMRAIAAIAAAVVCAVALTAWFAASRRDPLTHLRSVAARVDTRPIEPRLAGFAYKPPATPRGGPSIEDDALLREAERVAGSAPAPHARGVALLLVGRTAEALPLLRRAAAQAPNDASCWNDLAAAGLVAAGRDTTHLRAAIAAADHAIALDPQSAAALFNRALAAERLGDDANAAAFYRLALRLERDSAWSTETRQHLARVTR